MLMNSFSTSADTLAFFEEKYPTLAKEEGLEMIQNKVPKLDATTYEVNSLLTPFPTLIRVIKSLCTDNKSFFRL
jgi:UDP-N-acetylglucosamine pyrophosphorylase